VAWSFQHSTFDINPLTDTYIQYCKDHFGQIQREYKIKGGKTEWEFPHFCLTTFLRNGETLTRYRFSKIEKAYLKDSISYLEEYGMGLWQDYKEDPVYKKEIGESYRWIRHFKTQECKHPPSNYFELGLLFAALECFMMLEEKNLL
jgi:hypothetical protein